MSDDTLKNIEDSVLRCRADNVTVDKKEYLDLIQEVRRLKRQLNPPPSDPMGDMYSMPGCFWHG